MKTINQKYLKKLEKMYNCVAAHTDGSMTLLHEICNEMATVRDAIISEKVYTDFRATATVDHTTKKCIHPPADDDGALLYCGHCELGL